MTSVNRPMSSHDWFKRASRVLPGGTTRINLHQLPFPQYADRGDGCYVYDVDGHRHLDFLSNYFVLVHGHSFKPVVRAVTEQIAKGSCFGLPTQHEVLLAEALCERIASVDQIRFANTGSEAVIAAIKAARAFTGKPKIAKIEGGYHGLSDHAEIGFNSSPNNWGTETPASTPYVEGTPEGVIDDVIVLPFNNLSHSLNILDQHKETVAGLIIELMPSRCSMIPVEPAYLEGLADYCASNNIILIFDEVISLRIAYGGMQELYNVVPDLTVMGKIIGGGLPVGAVGGRKDIMSVFDASNGPPKVPQGGTFTANPLTMVAGLTAISHLNQSMIAQLNAHGAFVRQQLSGAMTEANLPGKITGVGSFFRINFKAEPITDYRSSYLTGRAAELTKQAYSHFRQSKILLHSNCSGAVSTPMTDDHINSIVSTFRQFIKSLK